jgi:hypothetical protein
MLEHAVLVDARFVCEGVSHRRWPCCADRLPTMFDSMREVGIEPGRVDAGVQVEERVARLQRHDDFFERTVAGAFADAVDGALDLAGAGDHRGQAVGHRHAEIVVAVHREPILSMPRTFLRR